MTTICYNFPKKKQEFQSEVKIVHFAVSERISFLLQITICKKYIEMDWNLSNEILSLQKISTFSLS